MSYNYATPDALASIAHHAQHDYVSTPRIRVVATIGAYTVAELSYPDGGSRWVTADRWGNYRDGYWVGPGFVTDDNALDAIAGQLVPPTIGAT